VRVFGFIFIGLLLASLVAWAIQPRPADPSKTPLIWASDDNPVRREHVELFNRLNPDCQLTLDAQNAGPEKVIVQATGGVGPDLFDSYGGHQLASYIEAGIAWDVTDALRATGVDLHAQVWPAMLPLVEARGRVWGFPANVVVDTLFFNKDIFEREGIPYPRGPWTWEEFLPLAKRLTIRDERGRVKRFGFYIDEWQWRAFIVQWGGSVYTPDGTRCVLDSPQSIAAMQMAQDLIYKYGVCPSPADESAMTGQGGYGTAGMKYFGAGSVATAIGGRWWLCTLRNYQGLRIGASESPHGPLRRFRSYGKCTCINARSPRREVALKFLRYMTGAEYNRLINLQADGLPPMMQYCTDADLPNPNYPDEGDMHRTFRDVMQYGVPEEFSPFVNNHLVERIVQTQYDLIRLNAKSPADAMREAARQVNEEIAKELKRDPELKRRYDALVATSANPSTQAVVLSRYSGEGSGLEQRGQILREYAQDDNSAAVDVVQGGAH
jgi:multiple sugar transport system substrate-binding protein